MRSEHSGQIFQNVNILLSERLSIFIKSVFSQRRFTATCSKMYSQKTTTYMATWHASGRVQNTSQL